MFCMFWISLIGRAYSVHSWMVIIILSKDCVFFVGMSFTPQRVRYGPPRPPALAPMDGMTQQHEAKAQAEGAVVARCPPRPHRSVPPKCGPFSPVGWVVPFPPLRDFL